MKLPPVQQKANTALHLILSFVDQATKDIFCGMGSKRASKAPRNTQTAIEVSYIKAVQLSAISAIF